MPRGLVVAFVAVVLAGCTASSGVVEVTATSLGPTTSTPGTTAGPTSSPTSGSSSSSTTLPAPALHWSPCDKGLECATLTVPLDYSDPTKGTIDLAVERRPASDPAHRIGSLLVNPGGPGVPGTSIPEDADGYLSDTLLERFDIVGWDPRGTGRSTHVDCADNLDPYLTLDPTPDTPAEKQALIDAGRDFAQKCQERSGRLLPYISTEDSAKDMEQLRRALGEDRVSYFGFSYGSELGATFATLFPSSVRAMVLDGAVDPAAPVVDQALQQTAALEHALDDFLANCAANRSCAFRNGGNPGAALDALLAQLDAHPLDVGGRQVGQGIAYTAIISALYDSQAWPLLATALARAQQGDGSGLAHLFDEYVRRADDGTYDNDFEALIAINCIDDPGPTDVGFPDRFAPQLQKVAPRLGLANAYGYFCTYWPARPGPKVPVTAAGAGPVVVVGTTGDAITPLEESKKMADELDQGVLLTVDAERHTGYGANGCVVRAVDRYLTDLQVPADGTVCR